MSKNIVKTAVINLKVDKDLKIKAANLAEQLGIPLSVVVQGGLRQFVAKQGISFFSYQPLSGSGPTANRIELKPSPYLQEAIKEARRERAKGNNYSFNSAAEAIKFLNKTSRRV
ncbi:MAG: hypothetical protein Q7K39_03565 [Candidatus Magasanikbacteria bacterium]|nr:hypothetical protein [Candidatus Magasanikbacteria bacterium]